MDRREKNLPFATKCVSVKKLQMGVKFRTGDKTKDV